MRSLLWLQLRVISYSFVGNFSPQFCFDNIYDLEEVFLSNIMWKKFWPVFWKFVAAINVLSFTCFDWRHRKLWLFLIFKGIYGFRSKKPIFNILICRETYFRGGVLHRSKQINTYLWANNKNKLNQFLIRYFTGICILELVFCIDRNMPRSLF